MVGFCSILRNNSFSGKVPEEVTELQELEILDLCDNNFGQPFTFGRRLLQNFPPGESPEFEAPPPPTEKAPVDALFPPFPSQDTGASPPSELQAETPNPPPPIRSPPAQPPSDTSLALPPAKPPPVKKNLHKIPIIVGVVIGVLVVMAALVAFFILRKQKAIVIKPWATRSSGQLQDVVIKGITFSSVTVLCLLD